MWQPRCPERVCAPDSLAWGGCVEAWLQIHQPRRWGQQKPAVLEMNLWNNRLHERNEQLAAIASLDLQQVIAATDEIGHGADRVSGGNDLLEIKRSDGSKLLIPFVEAIVPEVHLQDGWLLLTPPPGLMDL